jgi:hypothetical protein
MKQLLSLLVLSALLASCGSKTDPAAGKADTAGGKSTATSEPAAATGGGATEAPATPGKGTYTAESGIIEMKSDAMGDMTITTYFKDHGATKATYTMVEMMGQKSGQVVVEKDGYVTTYDLTSKTGQKRKLPPGAASGASGMSGAMPDVSQFAAMSAEDKAKYKFAELESRTIAGKEGKGYSMEMSGMKMKAWVWDNIPLRMEMEMGGPKPMVIEATKIETDVAVPDDKFAIPADVKITES